MPILIFKGGAYSFKNLGLKPLAKGLEAASRGIARQSSTQKPGFKVPVVKRAIIPKQANALVYKPQGKNIIYPGCLSGLDADNRLSREFYENLHFVPKFEALKKERKKDLVALHYLFTRYLNRNDVNYRIRVMSDAAKYLHGIVKDQKKVLHSQEAYAALISPLLRNPAAEAPLIKYFLKNAFLMLNAYKNNL
ncbi:MAG: hypothetical protein VKJ06_02350 [Vampirovibrionales bacterium]|nr:hypothetical protein [Vampirovibrionales bacterium]